MADLFCPSCKNGFRSYVEAHAQGWTGSAFDVGQQCPECGSAALDYTHAKLKEMFQAALHLNANQADMIRQLEARLKQVDASQPEPCTTLDGGRHE